MPADVGGDERACRIHPQALLPDVVEAETDQLAGQAAATELRQRLGVRNDDHIVTPVEVGQPDPASVQMQLVTPGGLVLAEPDVLTVVAGHQDANRIRTRALASTVSPATEAVRSMSALRSSSLVERTTPVTSSWVGASEATTTGRVKRTL